MTDSTGGIDGAMVAAAANGGAHRRSETDVLDDYARPSLGSPAQWDEMVDPLHGVRAPWREIGATLRVLGRSGLLERRHTVERMLADDGVTYRAHGTASEQQWQLDPVPMLLDEAQWAELEPGLVQRTELLDLILADLYGPRRLVGLIPPELVFAHPGFVRAVDQIRLPGRRQLFLAAADLARGPDGDWQVLADRTQAPSGAGYAMENRRVVSRALPGLYRDTRIHRIGPFFHAMRLSLQQLSPTPNEVPRVVLLTPGARSETAFDQGFLSSLLGFPLVEGADLTIRDGRVWQRSIGRLEPVDVILRRVDAWFCDPLELRPDSQLGVPGLVEAARLGNVSVANGLGTGVLENPGLYPYLPRLAEVLLDQPLRLPSAQTWWCGDPLSRQHVLANLDSLVLKPVSRRIARNSRFGWLLSARQREELTRRIAAEPHAWVGQLPLAPSTAPTVGRQGLEARPVLLRTFAVAHGESYRVLAGGLTRVAPDLSSTIVSNQSGAIAKDVWVIAGGVVASEQTFLPDDVRPEPVIAAISPRVAEDLFWLGRYAERAESLARLMGSTDNRWRDVHPAADPALASCVEVLLRALPGVGPGWPPRDPGSDLLALIGDEQQPDSLAHDVRRMRELANAVRDQLSNDTWAVLGGLDRGISPESGDLAEMLSTLLEALLAFSGLAAESMVRDTGWHFMDAGRRLERAIQLTRLLGSCLLEARSAPVEALVVESVLITAESIITHRRRYPAQSGVETVLQLLLLDRDNPRSLAFQLDRLGADLRRVAATEGDSLTENVRHVGAYLREADAGALAAYGSDDRRGELDGLLAHVTAELHDLGVAIERAHFVQAGALRPLQPADAFGTLEPA